MDAESAVSLVKRLCNFTQLFESGKIEMLPVETNQVVTSSLYHFFTKDVIISGWKWFAIEWK